jgi:hypothetical protein
MVPHVGVESFGFTYKKIHNISWKKVNKIEINLMNEKIL